MTEEEKKSRPIRTYLSELASGKRSFRLIVRMNLEERKRAKENARRVGLSLSSVIRHLLTLDPGLFRRMWRGIPDDTEPPSSEALK